MARRKKQYISDDDLDSSGPSESELEGGREDADWDEDADERAERLRFSDPYGRARAGKRKRGAESSKEEALYGIWAEQEDEEGQRGRGAGGRSSKALRRWVQDNMGEHWILLLMRASGQDASFRSFRHIYLKSSEWPYSRWIKAGQANGSRRRSSIAQCSSH